MLAPSATTVVIMLDETINPGGKPTAERTPKTKVMDRVYKSATVTKSYGKPQEWNEVNPISEKPKFGRGTWRCELKQNRGAKAQINDCRPQGNRTWLT